MTREELKKEYQSLALRLGVGMTRSDKINVAIHSCLRQFMETHNRVALYCNGYHTKMLMTDFVSDIRDIVCIVDNSGTGSNGGYKIVNDKELEKYRINGVIISSYKYREEIKESLKSNHAGIDILDIYDSLSAQGIDLPGEFYCAGPYYVYGKINQINNRLKNEQSDKETLLRELVKLFLLIKDFRMSAELYDEICKLTDDQDDVVVYKQIKNLYYHQLLTIRYSSPDNVLLLCLDGMRRGDFLNGKLKKTYDYLEKNGRIYTNAYSYSTMTYESLVPSFSENSNQKTRYYLRDDVDASNCRFYKRAIQQNRKIHIYGDGNKYISSDDAVYSGSPQTVTEKIWEFTLDLCETGNGLFYLHELYETHFSFPNPYTASKMVSSGTAMLFDFLPKNGGRLKTDYRAQLRESINYIDDTLAPILSILPCSFLLFADHGNMLLDEESKLYDIKRIQLVASEEWIRIPWIMVSPHIEVGTDDSLLSLMDLNDAVISLLDKVPFHIDDRRSCIKIGRSAIYNPDFRELYRLMNCDYDGEAFEGFIFRNNTKLIVYSNGKIELYSTDTDELLTDKYLTDELFEGIRDQITI